jgi:GrpB-like predicted nucleotidyltransferase (UPF0157 family)
MMETGTEFWNRHLGFRNYLRQNPDTRDAYGDLKKHLAKKNGRTEMNMPQQKQNLSKALRN